MASLVSTRHAGFVSSCYAIGDSRSVSGHDSSKRGSNQLKLLPWTLPELGRLLWQFVCSPSKSLFIVWHWSIWRRRKQEQARQCHYRRYAQRTQLREQSQTRVELKHKTYPTVLSERQWEAAQRVIPVEHLVGRPRTTDLRQVLNALCYMQATQCSVMPYTSVG